jgi:hypothetical protein
MPKRQTVYKVSIAEVEKTLALMQVTKDEEAANAITTFCTAFSIPLDNARVKAQRTEFEVLAKMLAKPKK